MIDVGVRVGAVIGMAVLACAGAPALADLPNPLADGLRHCASESDQGKRLACFDALAAGLPKVEADQFGLTADIAHKRQPQVKEGSGASGAVAGGTTGGATSSGVAAGGGTAARGATGGAVAGSAVAGGAVAGGAAGTEATAGAPDATKNTESKPAGQFLPGKIKALRQGAGGVLVFTLDNNQVWVQANADTRFSFNVGEDVRIEHGAMGSFWLAANKGRKTKVKRVS